MGATCLGRRAAGAARWAVGLTAAVVLLAWPSSGAAPLDEAGCPRAQPPPPASIWAWQPATDREAEFDVGGRHRDARCQPTNLLDVRGDHVLFTDGSGTFVGALASGTRARLPDVHGGSIEGTEAFYFVSDRLVGYDWADGRRTGYELRRKGGPDWLDGGWYLHQDGAHIQVRHARSGEKVIARHDLDELVSGTDPQVRGFAYPYVYAAPSDPPYHLQAINLQDGSVKNVGSRLPQGGAVLAMDESSVLVDDPDGRTIHAVDVASGRVAHLGAPRAYRGGLVSSGAGTIAVAWYSKPGASWPWWRDAPTAGLVLAATAPVVLLGAWAVFGGRPRAFVPELETGEGRLRRWWGRLRRRRP